MRIRERDASDEAFTTSTGKTVRPRGRWVLVELDPPDGLSEHGLIEIPDEFRRQQTHGTVRAAGPGGYVRKDMSKKKNRESDEPYEWVRVSVKAGDRVLVGAWNGMKLEAAVAGKADLWMMDGDKDIYLVEGE